jgi:hypothetical protein
MLGGAAAGGAPGGDRPPGGGGRRVGCDMSSASSERCRANADPDSCRYKTVISEDVTWRVIPTRRPGRTYATLASRLSAASTQRARFPVVKVGVVSSVWWFDIEGY